MPPKPRFTREALGSSARPIFTVFRSMEKLPVWLLLAASVLLVLDGALWGLLAQWPCAALSWVGAIGCGAAAALHFSGDEK